MVENPVLEHLKLEAGADLMCAARSGSFRTVQSTGDVSCRPRSLLGVGVLQARPRDSGRSVLNDF